MILEVIQNRARNNPGKIGIGVDASKLEVMIKVKEKVEKRKLAKLEFVEDEKTLIQGLKDDTFDGIVRGQLPSSKFLKYLKTEYNLKECYRLALLETSSNHEFFFAPVESDALLLPWPLHNHRPSPGRWQVPR